MVIYTNSEKYERICKWNNKWNWKVNTGLSVIFNIAQYSNLELWNASTYIRVLVQSLHADVSLPMLPTVTISQLFVDFKKAFIAWHINVMDSHFTVLITNNHKASIDCTTWEKWMFTIIVFIWNYPNIALGFLRFLAHGVGTNKTIHKKITDFLEPIKDLSFFAHVWFSAQCTIF